MGYDLMYEFQKPDGALLQGYVPRESLKQGYPWVTVCAKAAAFGLNGIPAIFKDNDYSNPEDIDWDRFEPRLAEIGVTKSEFINTEFRRSWPVNCGLNPGKGIYK